MKTVDTDLAGKDVCIVPFKREYLSYETPSTLSYFCGILVTSGSMTCKLDLSTYSTTGRGMFIILPYQELGGFSVSDDYQAKIIKFSGAFIETLAIDRSYLSMYFIKEHPFLEMDDKAMETMDAFMTIFRYAEESENPRRFEVIRHMCRAAYYSLLNYVDASAYFQNNDHGMEVCRKFLELVNEECMKHRDLYYYAMRLSMSPKTLYSLVKSKTGTSPSRMIAGCTIQKAKHILSTTDKTVGQISDMFGFCSQSDFGKYFKRETGLSPKHYRRIGE